MTTSNNPTTTAAAIATPQFPLSYNDVDTLSYWAEVIRDRNGATAGTVLEHFGKCMSAYASIQRIPAGLISNGYIQSGNGPRNYSGAYSFFVELYAGGRGLAGVTDYRTGLPVEDQAFVQLFVPTQYSSYSDTLIDQGVVKDLIVRANLNSKVVRFELLDPSSKLYKQLAFLEGISDVRSIPVVLPVESKGTDLTQAEAAAAKRAMTRRDNGTEMYNQVSNNPIIRTLAGLLGS